MNANVKLSQQDEGTRKQNERARKIVVRMTAPEKSTTSSLSAIKGLLPIG